MSHITKNKTKTLSRVRRIKGQVEAIERALEGEGECEEVLQLVASCRGALNGLMAELIEGFVADAQQRITEIWTTQDIGFAGRFAGQLEDLRRFYLRYNPAAGDRNVWSPLARLRLDLPVLGELGTSALERVDRVYDASLRQAVAAAIRTRELAPRTPIEDVTRILRVTLMSCAPMNQDSGSFAELEELLAALHRMIVAGWGRNTA